MKRLVDHFLYQFERLGRVGALGAVLITIALVVDLVHLRSMQGELYVLTEKNELAAIATPVRGKSLEGRAQGMTLPVSPAAEDTLRQLFVAASKNGLTLDQGDYTLSGERSGNIYRYQISLPVYGSYPTVRAFVAQALNENPALALAYAEMRRSTIEDTDLETTLRFTLFVKEGK